MYKGEHTMSVMTPQQIIQSLGEDTKKATRALNDISSDLINEILSRLAESIKEKSTFILSENKKDIDSAQNRGLNEALIDRLLLNDDRIDGMISGIQTVRDLEDPTSKIQWETNRPNGLHIQRISCPIGVLGMIYESRPNVTIDSSILCLKSRNAVILRGGSESLHSSLALHSVIQNTLEENNIPPACVSMIPSSDRNLVGEMLRASHYIDVMIPRGGKGLIERVMNEARMPVFSHLDGICHVYVDHDVDSQTAKDVTLNAKMRRTGICGAAETLLFHKDIDRSLAHAIIDGLITSGCDVVGDQETQELHDGVSSASDDDWSTEYLDAKISVKFVDDTESAISHINLYGSHHTDSILTNNKDTASLFQKNVDSGIVMHNASTQFADGGEFGMGAEIGIATGKMHARGPVGLEQLCSYKYLVHGNGQTRP